MNTKEENTKFPRVTKKIVRNKDVNKPNVAVQRTVKHLKQYPNGLSSRDNSKQPEYKDKSADMSIDLTKPGLCTALHIADDIIKTVTAERNQDDLKTNFTTGSEIGPAFKPSVKVLKKVNIPFTEQVYKDLVNLEITDENLCLGKSVLPSRTKEFLKNKDKVPVLSDYYQPLFSQEYKIEKQVPQFDIEKIKYYDGYRVTDKVKATEVNSRI